MRRSSGFNFLGGSMTISGLQKIKDDEAAVEAYRSNPPAPEPVFDPMTLTTMQQAALMQMMESHVKRAVIARLLEDAQDRPGTPEYHSLVDLGLAELKPGKRYHDVTMMGRFTGCDLEAKLCRKFDIHLLIEGGYRGHQQHFHCCCGFSTYVDRGHNARSHANHNHYVHSRTAKGMRRLVAVLTAPQRAEG